MEDFEIRAWYDGRMYEVLAIDWENRLVTMRRLEDKNYRVTNSGSVFDDTVLLRPTGLKDKNGVEIYEGDVVRSNRTYPRDSEAAKKFNGYVGQVYYDVELGSWWITTTAEPSADHEHTCQAATVDAFEVIGNIYENPELLEKNHA